MLNLVLIGVNIALIDMIKYSFQLYCLALCNISVNGNYAVQNDNDYCLDNYRVRIFVLEYPSIYIPAAIYHIVIK